jgi:soluble P-type ATPase
VPFTAQTRMSGVDLPARRQAQIRKGAADAIRRLHVEAWAALSRRRCGIVDDVARRGSTPLVVADGARVLGVVELKDIVKGGIKERFAELRRMGIKTVMITGDNPLTAAAIAAEAGVDDFLAEATPEAKLALIREYQAEGRLVAMTGDGTNDAPALAQADVAVAMNTGTQAAKEAGNMVDLDSNPTKLIEIVETGKQLLMTRGSLTTFSIANDVAKYFAIIPAAFVTTYPQLAALNVMGLASPSSAILSAVIFNALIIVALIPLALGGLSRCRRRQPGRQGRQGHRLDTDRPELHRPEALLGQALGDRPLSLQRGRFRRLQPGSAEPRAGRCRQGPHRRTQGRRSGQREAGTGRPGHGLGQRPGPAYQPGSGTLPVAAHRRRTQVVHRARGKHDRCAYTRARLRPFR